MRRGPAAVAVAAVGLALGAAAAHAGQLPLGPGRAALVHEVARICPRCAAHGVVPCGTADVRFGRGFARTVLAGNPGRGYLPAFHMTGEQFRTLARTTPDPATLVATLRERFRDTPLVVLETGFARARLLEAPRSVDVEFPAPLHACVRDPAKPWGCCASDCAAAECCEKALGSPTVRLVWDDPESGETLTWMFGHVIGTSTLRRFGKRGGTFYYCLVDAPGFLR